MFVQRSEFNSGQRITLYKNYHYYLSLTEGAMSEREKGTPIGPYVSGRSCLFPGDTLTRLTCFNVYIIADFVKCGVLTLVGEIRHCRNDRYSYYIQTPAQTVHTGYISNRQNTFITKCVRETQVAVYLH